MRRNDRKKLSEFPIPDILESEETYKALSLIVGNKDINTIKDTIYKGKFRDTATGKDRFAVRERLSEIYFSKCAYCEDIEAKPEVEHYRPKKKVSEDKTHPGYYWLCYEWTNLLPSCHFCNSEGGKGNRFPIKGLRVCAHPTRAGGEWNQAANDPSVSPLIDEQPYLLNPEIDYPDSGGYFKFYNNGRIEGIDAEGRGEKTVEICDLNRDNLLLRRQKLVIDPILKSIRNILLLQNKNLFEGNEKFIRALELVFEGLSEMMQPDQSFSLLAIYIYTHFDEIIVPLIATPELGEAVSAAFADFRKRQDLDTAKYDRDRLRPGADRKGSP